MSKIIWMSDLHFAPVGDVSGQDPRLRLDAAVEYINQHHGDAAGCVISGDLAENGSAEVYAALRPYLDRLSVPWFPMVGNHDERGAFLQGLPLPEGRQDGFAQYNVILPGASLLCLDTLKPGAAAGEMCKDRLGWLEAELQRRPDVPAYIFMHHPPVDLGLPMLDTIRMENGDALMALLARHPQVCHVFAGHVHRPCSARVRGLNVTTMKSVLIQSPAPWPDWKWDSFAPADEAPAMGVLHIDGPDMRLQYVEFL